MTEARTADHLANMQRAVEDARGFVEGMSRHDFLGDRRTQQAVVMSLVILGEAAAQVMDRDAAFAAAHPHVPWRSMRGMRNRIAHGYFDIDLDVVWQTVTAALPTLQAQLATLQPGSDADSPARP